MLNGIVGTRNGHILNVLKILPSIPSECWYQQSQPVHVRNPVTCTHGGYLLILTCHSYCYNIPVTTGRFLNVPKLTTVVENKIHFLRNPFFFLSSYIWLACNFFPRFLQSVNSSLTPLSIFPLLIVIK